MMKNISNIKIYETLRIKNKQYHKELILKDDSNDNDFRELKVNRLALVGKDDKIALSADTESSIYIYNDTTTNSVKIFPSYKSSKVIFFAGKKYTLKFNELNNERDFHDYEYLSRFHYRTLTKDKQNDVLKNHVHVRTSIIICRIIIGKQKIPVGYIQLQQPLMMCKPRHLLFNDVFEHRPFLDEWLD